MTNIDIRKRVFEFSVLIINLSNALPRTPAGYAVANQIARSGTSVGANIEEAQDGLSRKDFVHSMNIALKESKETLYWLKIIGATELIEKGKLEGIIDENTQIMKILTTIVKKARRS